jgi:hypothetical protein
MRYELAKSRTIESNLMHGSQNTTRRLTDTQVIQCLRVGAPPYRFSGTALARAQTDAGNDSDLFVELWARRKGGFTVSFSRWTGTGWHPDAYNAPTLSAAMDQMESICATQNGATDALPSSCPNAFVDQITKTARLYNQLNLFQALVGRALDAWTDIEQAPCTTS